MANFERHTLGSPYHYCSICWWRYPLDKLTWQLGQLRCPKDVDTMLIGEREAMIMRALSTGNPQDELAPDKKLTEPFNNNSIDQIIL